MNGIDNIRSPRRGTAATALRAGMFALLLAFGGFTGGAFAQGVANGDFSYQKIGTTATVSGAGGITSGSTFSNWRLLANNATNGTTFSATIVTNPSSSGNLAVRLDYNKPAGGATPVDYRLDRVTAPSSLVPVAYGTGYTFSFDAAHIAGSGNLQVLLPEYTNGVFAGKQAVTNILVANSGFQRFSFDWTPLGASNNFPLTVGVVFKPLLSGSDTNTALMLDNVQFAKTSTSPGLYTSRPSLTVTNHLVATSVFHWFETDRGQSIGPWRPLDGRINWTGNPEWWKTQVKQMMMANIDILYVHLIPVYEQQRVNLFQALNELRHEGYDVPKVAPFLDPPITWNNKPLVDVATEAGKDELTSYYIRFFNQYYSVNQDPHADDYLARIDDRPMLDTWQVKNQLTNIGSLTRSDITSRLAASFGQAHPLFNNDIYMVASMRTPTFDFVDETVPQFESSYKYYYAATNNGIVGVHLNPGFWDQNIRNPGHFVPRDGGIHFTDAWNMVDRNVVRRIHIQSWNEYNEGSGVYAADPGTPYIEPGSGNTNTDVWSSSNDPYEYIHTTAAGAAAFNDLPTRDATILYHNFPTNMAPGEVRQVTVIVRNEGDASWTAAGQFKFGERDFDPVRFGAGRYLLDDAQDEIPVYGGIFRGRPRTFQLTLTAPTTPGSYVTHWGMMQESVAWFGQQLEIPITVKLKAAADVALGNLLQVYDGTGRNASATTTPPGLAVDFTYDGEVDAPTNVGSYTVIGTIDDPDYAGSSTNTLFIMENPERIANGSFEVQPAGTTKSIGSGGGVDSTTFTGWRVFSVGSPAVSNFTATIITNATDGNLAMRLDLINTGGGTGLDHGLDNNIPSARMPVAFGTHYTISFDAAWISGATALTFGVAEFDASGAFTGKSTTTNLVVADTAYHTYTLANWTPITNATTHATVAFRQQNSGGLTYSAMSFDKVRFTDVGTSQATALSVSGTTATIGFEGSPGYAYVVQQSTNLLEWVNISTNIVPGNGSFAITNDIGGQPPVPNAAFYRLWRPW